MIDFNVQDMTCGYCVTTITRAVNAVDAAARCEIDLPAKRVRIASAMPSGAFLDAIRKAGYTPVPTVGTGAA